MPTRRGFLLGLGAFSAAAMAAPALVHAENLMKIAPLAPHLWVDGVHDDALALQWRLDRSMGIKSGNYRVESGLILKPKTNNLIKDVRIVSNMLSQPLTRPLIDGMAGAHYAVIRCTFLSVDSAGLPAIYSQTLQ